ncbi:acyl-CoA dehydrogenase family protein [Ferrimonas sp.]|uniref:acyl-CoA dehydrogenase family protein n=1 Tax=Ferrimonas sp. TaxID=2080861 RepID=UPI003A8E81DD
MFPRTLFDSDHQLFRDSVRRFLEAEVVPFHAQWEKEGCVDRGLWLKAGEQGFLCPTLPEAYGGVEVDFRYNVIINEEIARVGASGLGWGLHSDIAVPYILHYGSEAQKQRLLPGCIGGELVTAIAMTEPGTGSDLQGIKTKAQRDGDGWLLSGAKTFITNGQHANLVIVVARTDPEAGSRGFSLFLVEEGMAGFSRGTNLEKIGMKAQDTSELFFDNVRLPADALLGEEGAGFAYLMRELPQERLSVASNAVANAESILEQTLAYVAERRAFGKPIAALQNTQFKLAECRTKVDAARVFTDRCIELHLEGKLDAAMAAEVKLLTTELQGEVLDECLQLHGGYGYMWEYPVARAWADARVQRIYAGTSEVMKLIIARKMLEQQ